MLVFYHCGKILEKNLLKGEKVYFGSQFWSIVSCPCCFGTCGRIPHLGREHISRKLKSEEREGKSWGTNIPFKGTPPVT